MRDVVNNPSLILPSVASVDDLAEDAIEANPQIRPQIRHFWDRISARNRLAESDGASD